MIPDEVKRKGEFLVEGAKSDDCKFVLDVIQDEIERCGPNSIHRSNTDMIVRTSIFRPYINVDKSLLFATKVTINCDVRKEDLVVRYFVGMSGIYSFAVLVGAVYFTFVTMLIFLHGVHTYAFPIFLFIGFVHLWVFGALWSLYNVRAIIKTALRRIGREQAKGVVTLNH